MIRVYFAAGTQRWDNWAPHLRAAFAARGLSVRMDRDPDSDPDYIIHAPGGDVVDFSRYLRVKAVMGLWAGVERIVSDPRLTQPLTRMADPGLRQGMVEWVAGHMLRHHLGLDAHITGQDGVWRQVAPPLASSRKIAVLGLGELGMAAARALSGLGFDVTGWSRRPKESEGIACLSGDAGLTRALTDAWGVVLLLPLTQATSCILNAQRLALLAPGAVVLNPGRGALIDDDALLKALDGPLGAATLDVFRTEPLPPDHPFWAHPKVTVTPHFASETRPESAAHVIAENIRRGEAGEPLLHLVDRAQGY